MSAKLDGVAREQPGDFECAMQIGSDKSEPVRWRFATAEFNERNHELTVSGQSVALEPKPLEVLLCLLRAEGELVTKDELFETVWAGRVVTDGVLSQAIRRIREVLGDGDRTMLRTVHGYGFRLDVPIEIEGRDDPGTQLQLTPGQSLETLPEWVLEERLQTRPANELWRIRHRESGQLRVIKLALDERAQRALKREVTLNKVLRAELGEGAPVVPLLEWHFSSSPAWIQMPWYEHGSLADWITAQGGPAQLDMRRRVNLVAEAAEALAKAHALGVMHKDIKPGNLLVERGAGQPRLLLCDFGSGTVKSRDRLEQAGVTVMGFTKTVNPEASTSGTPAYMAPEVLKGGVFSEQSDIYALGILLYQLVIGDLTEPMAAGWEEDVSDAALRGIISAACAGKPVRRVPSMQTLAQAIRDWQPQKAAAVETAASPRKVPKRRVAFAALAVVFVFALWLWQDRASDTNPSGSQGGFAAVPDMGGQRVAILSFELLGLDEQTQTIMAGLQDALLADLASLSEVRLVHGQNLEALGLSDAGAEKVGRALSADHLIRGSVQQADAELRVNLQIVDAARGETIWGQAVTGTRSNLFALQADIAQTLARALGTTLDIPGDRAINNEAYEAYLAALSLWKQGLGNTDELAAELEKALALDPQFIDAHLLALLKAARDYWFSSATREESESRIAEHLRALESQDTSPVKLATARAVRRYYLEHDPRGGVEILAPFRRNLLRNTESAMFYAYMLRRIGRTDEAFTILDAIIDQDPSAATPVETKAELMAFLGRGRDAVALLQEAAERFGTQGHAALKAASFGYDLTGDVRFVELGRKALESDDFYSGMRAHADMELARRAGDWETVRNLARANEGEDKTVSAHGRMPSELLGALALRAGQAPVEEVRARAQVALDRLTTWRNRSDSASRRSITAIALALLGRADEALQLTAQVETDYPLERDQIEAADRTMDATIVHALLGDEKAVMQRLQTLRQSLFYATQLCALPQGFEHQPVWEMAQARSYISEQCDPLWKRNQRELSPILEALEGA
ncbi:MAG: winged helix-turn-helix domain-containing protein [Oceanococcaceae bacterium]